MQERLQKILSAQGVCSRRAAEEYITAGRVTVNGQVAELGQSADAVCDEIKVDGHLIASAPVLKLYFMLNKPKGYVTTAKDEAGRKTVLDLLSAVTERVYPVGRLDMESEGLLLLTNDGALANRLTHPSHEVYKEYLVKITGKDTQLPDRPDRELSRPLELDGKPLAPAICNLVRHDGTSCFLTIRIREGRNRQVRRMCDLCGFEVKSLKRIAIGKLELGKLAKGEYRPLTECEITYLKGL